MKLTAARVPWAVTPGRPHFLVGLCPQNEAVYHLKVKEVTIQFLSVLQLQFLILALPLYLRKATHSAFLPTCKQTGRHGLNRKVVLKKKRASAVCISMSPQKVSLL